MTELVRGRPPTASDSTADAARSGTAASTARARVALAGIRCRHAGDRAQRARDRRVQALRDIGWDSRADELQTGCNLDGGASGAPVLEAS